MWFFHTCHEISASILDGERLMLTTACAKIKEDSINVESETRKVDSINVQESQRFCCG